MCEIAILDPSKYSSSEIYEAAATVYNAMGHSLGILATHDRDGRFEHDVFKAVTPDEDALGDFIEEQSDAVRLVIHGRLATHGEVNIQNTHPLEIDCDECAVDYVVHNGVIYGADETITSLEARGHEFSTGVDSEVLAHTHESVPVSFEDGATAIHNREPAYILANDERLYIHTSGVYRLSQRGEMARGSRTFGPDAEDGGYRQVILTPSEEED